MTMTWALFLLHVRTKSPRTCPYRTVRLLLLALTIHQATRHIRKLQHLCSRELLLTSTSSTKLEFTLAQECIRLLQYGINMSFVLPKWLETHPDSFATAAAFNKVAQVPRSAKLHTLGRTSAAKTANLGIEAINRLIHLE